MKKKPSALPKMYLVNPKDLVWNKDGTTVIGMKRKYGKYKRTVLLCEVYDNGSVMKEVFPLSKTFEGPLAD